MKITEKQLICLVQTLNDTLVFIERQSGDPFSFSLKQRQELLNTILNQQSDLFIDVDNNGESDDMKYCKTCGKSYLYFR